MLELRDVHAYYGKSHVLQGVDLRLAEGEIVALLGRNGAGRSTMIKAIMGDVACTGTIRFKDRDILGLKPHEIARLGVGYVPENRDVFPGLTVRENLLLGQKNPRSRGRWSCRTCSPCFLASRSGPKCRPPCFPAASSRC